MHKSQLANSVSGICIGVANFGIHAKRDFTSLCWSCYLLYNKAPVLCCCDKPADPLPTTICYYQLPLIVKHLPTPMLLQKQLKKLELKPGDEATCIPHINSTISFMYDTGSMT